MKSITIVIIFIIAFLIPPGVDAEIYFWTDENGVRHYSQTPPADRTVMIKTAREIRTDPEVSQTRAKIDESNVEALLEELDKVDTSSTPAPSRTPQEPTGQERIQIEREKLKEKLAYLQNLPPESFANSRSRNVIIGQYQYRLQQLKSDPDAYFEKYGF